MNTLKRSECAILPHANCAAREPGNAAALREALKEARKVIEAMGGYWARVTLPTIDAALAAPARNCDVGTAEEQAARLRQYCLDKDSLDCRHYCMQSPKAFGCSMEWAQMPYEEGGAE